MAYEKTTWVDGETEINAQKLNKMEQGIEEAGQTGGILTGSIVAYDGDTIPEGYEEVENPNVYSSKEVFTGKYWIDGKPLYRKVIGYTPTAEIGATGKTTEIKIPHGIANLQRRFVEFACNNSGISLPIMSSSNGTTVTTATMIKQIDATDVIMRIVNDTWGTSNTFYICINYTKTTD